MELKDIINCFSTLQIKDVSDWIGAIISVFGAFGSGTYFRKSRQLTLYTKTNSSFIESINIKNELLEITRLSNKSFRGSINTLSKRVGTRGTNIKASINKIKENMTSKDVKKIDKILNSNEINVYLYIQYIISGDIVENEKVNINSEFRKCEKAFDDMQQFIKDKLDSISEKLK